MNRPAIEDLVAELEQAHSYTTRWPFKRAAQALRELLADAERYSHLPRIVCLCGSTRFYEAFVQANYDETMAGRIVLSVGHYPHRPETLHGEQVGCTPAQKIELDKLHFRKIELADEILVLNVAGYIGESTRNEINHATALGKPIRYLETPAAIAGQQEICE